VNTIKNNTKTPLFKEFRDNWLNALAEQRKLVIRKRSLRVSIALEHVKLADAQAEIEAEIDRLIDKKNRASTKLAQLEAIKDIATQGMIKELSGGAK
jgi:hypothetical protein